MDPSIKDFLIAHGSKLTCLDSRANLGELFAHCTNVVTWRAFCSSGVVSCAPLQAPRVAGICRP